MAFYFPEGSFGPVCDSPVSDAAIRARSRRAVDPIIDRREDTFPPLPDSFYDPVREIIEPAPTLISRIRCEKDDEGNYINCEYEYVGDLRLPEPPLVSEEKLGEGFGLKDDFFVPPLGPESCSPYDPDINIRPITFFLPGGQIIKKYKRQKSTPVTYNVASNSEFIVEDSDIDATFNSSGNLVVTGSGNANIDLTLRWDDNPNTYDVALDTYTVKGLTLTQSGTKGKDSGQINAGAGTYTASIVGNSGGFVIQDGGKKICFRDEDGSDCNASLTIGDITNSTNTTNASFWSEEGNNYAVWVNPEVCTLPREEQTVTYQIPIPVSGQYAFRFACDDNAKLFLEDEETPILDIAGGIFRGGALNTPYTATRTLTAGTLECTVKCTNSDAGFTTDGKPSGLAYSWGRNPGGWFLKVCQGSGCTDATDVSWVQSGPIEAWGSFMNKYAVYPSNTEVLTGTAHTATWNVNVPYAGNYEFEYSVDNVGTWSLDGTQIASASSNFTTSATYTISNLSAGPHQISATVTNTANSQNNTWANNPGGTAWTLKMPSANQNLTARFLSNGALQVLGSGQADLTLNFAWDEDEQVQSQTSNLNASFNNGAGLVVGGTGSGTIELELEYDDNPNTHGTAISTWSVVSGSTTYTLTRNLGLEEGSDTVTIPVTAGQTYAATVVGNDGGWSITASSQSICFRDSDGNDCNARIKIKNINNSSSQVTLNPDKALGTYRVSTASFTQTSAESGSGSATIAVEGGKTYSATIIGNEYGFSVQNNGQKLCFRDSGGTDCNASVTIGSFSGSDAIIATSLDTGSEGDGNLIWHTRMASGYEYYEQ